MIVDDVRQIVKFELTRYIQINYILWDFLSLLRRINNNHGKDFSLSSGSGSCCICHILSVYFIDCFMP